MATGFKICYQLLVTLIIDTHPSKQRNFTTDELHDDVVIAGDYVGTAFGKRGRIWHFDGSSARMVGVANHDHRSMAVLKPGKSLRDAFAGMAMFTDEPFVIQRMVLPPGAFYHRIARPSDQHPHEAPGGLPNYGREAEAVIGSLNQLRTLVGMLESIFQAAHPVAANMGCFGSSIRNLLILACTECEAQWRGVLLANGYPDAKLKTTDYIKILPVMRLAEYGVRLQHYPWLNGVMPFAGWDAAAPTQSLIWYDDYNAAKHDREGAFARASLGSAVLAVAAVWVMIAAQFGIQGVREFDDLSRYFHLERVPLWRYSDVYAHGYDGHDGAAGPRNFQF